MENRERKVSDFFLLYYLSKQNNLLSLICNSKSLVMQVILIDPVTETVEYKSIDRRKTGLAFRQQVYDLIGNGCTLFEVPITYPDRSGLFCDEEGLFHENIGGFIFPNWSYAICGRAVIMGCDENGDSCSTKVKIDLIKEQIKFLKPDHPHIMSRFAMYN